MLIGLKQQGCVGVDTVCSGTRVSSFPVNTVVSGLNAAYESGGCLFDNRDIDTAQGYREDVKQEQKEGANEENNIKTN